MRVERPYAMKLKRRRDLQRRHNLSPVVSGPFGIIQLDSERVVIRRDDDVERISRGRVVTAPDPTPDGTSVQTAAAQREKVDSVSTEVRVSS